MKRFNNSRLYLLYNILHKCERLCMLVTTDLGKEFTDLDEIRHVDILGSKITQGLISNIYHIVRFTQNSVLVNYKVNNSFFTKLYLRVICLIHF